MECLIRDVERAVLGPSERALRQAHFFSAERLSVRMPCVLLVRAAIPDMRARDDQRRTILDASRDGQRGTHGSRILTVDPLNVPAIRFEPRADVLCKRDVGRGGKRNQIGVVKDDQPAEPQRAG
jgi:hypothetical protein